MHLLTRPIHVGILALRELSVDDQRIVRMAADVRRHAQAPYSHYHVGAAARFADGIVGYGVNIENASYTQTTHAEQSAIAHRVATHGPCKLEAMAIVGAPAGEVFDVDVPQQDAQQVRFADVKPSCGHCLQIIWEQSGGDRGVKLLQLLMKGNVAVTTIGDAFPFSFGASDLGIDPFARKS